MNLLLYSRIWQETNCTVYVNKINVLFCSVLWYVERIKTDRWVQMVKRREARINGRTNNTHIIYLGWDV